jgi:hypothetical protein
MATFEESEMNARDKRRFINELIRNVRTDILAKVSAMPDEWDGHELRRYIADKFEESVTTVGRAGHYGKPHRRRFRDYRNEVLVRNL